MAATLDLDPILESLLDELRSQLGALNDVHHPVYPTPAKRILELEARVADLKSAITARKSALRAAK